jgi:hypothetical protein
MVLPYPDKSLPKHQVSIQDYVNMASRILAGPDTIHDFCRMVLAGHADIDGIEHHLFVNARQGLEEIDTGTLTISRDYDSVSSCTNTLPFSGQFSIYPVAPFRETLKVNNHLIGKAFDRQVSGK